MTVEELKRRLAELPGTFVLTDTDLGIDAVKQLFDRSLPESTLTLAKAQAVSGELAVTGSITLAGVGSGAPLGATLSFAADASQNVSGVQILVTLDTWSVNTSYLALDFALLSQLGFQAARLALVAEPDSNGVAEPAIGLEADLPFDTTGGSETLTLRGLEPAPPPAGASVPDSLWELEAEFTGVTFEDLGRLAALATGLESSAFHIPTQVPVADQVELTQLRVVFDASDQVVVAVAADVQVADKWPIVTGKCELEDLTAAFTITYPTRKPAVAAALSGTLEIAGVEVVASISVPELELVAQLGEPLDVQDVFTQYFHTAASIPMEVAWLMLTLDASASPVTWYVGFGAGAGEPGGWTLVGDVKLDDVSVQVSGTGTSPTSANLTAAFGIGDASVVLGGGWDTNAGWTLTGNTVGTSDLEIGQLLDVFRDKFHTPLPAALANLDLTYVGMTVAASGPSFTFQCTGDFPLGAATADFVVNVAVSGSPLSQTSTGTLTLSIPDSPQAETMTFAVAFDTDATKTTFTAGWSDTAGLGLGDVARCVGIDVSEIPVALLPVVTSLALGYDSNGPIVALGVDTADTKSVWAVTGTGTRAYYGAVTASTSFRLSQLPVVGHDVPASDDIGIDSFDLVIGSAALQSSVAQQVNALVPVGVTLPQLAAAGAYLSVAYEVAGVTQPPLTLSPGAAQQQQQLVQGAETTTSPPSGGGPPTAWMNLQQSFGPVDLQRAGVSYTDGTLWLLLDGSLRAGPLALDLENLGVGFALGGSDPWVPEFRLDGLGVAYSAASLTIAGSLTNLSPPGGSSIDFEGGVVIETEAFTLEAFGYYGNGAGPDGFTSMFLFLEGGAEIGGPPFFFVTGFAGGFGYNSALTLPSVDQVAGFPMIAALPGTPQYDAGALGGAQPSPLTVLQTLTSSNPAWISPALGEFWGAAGITFTTFELVQSQALLVVEAGRDVSLALLGLSTARLPQEGSSVYAQVELELEARLEPDEGELWFEAVLAPSSFVIDPACHLTGGFAFCTWFAGNPHAGDFVLTLGGYHPAFSPPDYYPTVPRLGFSWALGGEVTVGGTAYLALTPSAFMLGGELDVTFQSGNLRAWLSAGADVILHWDPFQFDAHIWVSVGASYRLDLRFTTVTLSAEIGADLELWGPPTGGTVTVDWYVIKFTIPFGSGPPTPDDASWDSVGKMLPTGGVSITAVSGLTSSAGVTAPDPAAPWVVRGSTFAFSTATPVPASRMTAGAAYDGSFSSLAVRPLAVTGLTSTHTVSVTDPRGVDVSGAFDVEPVLGNVPASLWGQPVDNQTVPSSSGQLVTGQAVGLSLGMKPPVTGASAGAIAVDDVLAHQDLGLQGAQLPVSPSAVPAGPTAEAAPDALATVTGSTGIASSGASSARATLVSQLSSVGVPVAQGVNPASFAEAAGTYVVSEPMLAVLA